VSQNNIRVQAPTVDADGPHRSFSAHAGEAAERLKAAVFQTAAASCGQLI